MQPLERLRHSLAHILANAVQELFPGTQLGFGPPTEDGFYYDVAPSQPIVEEDLPRIEAKMRQIIAKRAPFERTEVPYEEAVALLTRRQEPLKAEYAKELVEKNKLTSLTFYTTGDFIDMCEGPHVEDPVELVRAGFSLKSLAGAYWRGDIKKIQMVRIYAWAFESPAALKTYKEAYEKAQARDHKKLGAQLELFVIDEQIGKGLPLWLPYGTVIRDELEKLMREVEFHAGYQRVVTPHLAKASLYRKTGHLPYYADSMFPQMHFDDKDEEPYCLRPMNCPHHHRIYASKKRSYRELPLRLAEYGQVYRYEDSGALSGLLRVRAMCMNDAHIYLREDQIAAEFLAVMAMHKQVYGILGLDSYTLRFSTWDPSDPKQKYVPDPEAWARTEKIVSQAMQASGLPMSEGRGEAAFYGPKIDIQFRTVTGREETASTNQLDFATPQRLDLTYVGADNQEHRPYIIHRAPLGTHERFVAFLIEHYGGAFPTWLAPIQVRIIPISERVQEYATMIHMRLRGHMLRAELDDSSESLSKKIRTASKWKIPNILVVGEKEQAEGTVMLRRFGSEEQVKFSLEAFETALLKSVAERAR